MKHRWYYFSVVAAILAAFSLSAPALAAGKQALFLGRSRGAVTTIETNAVAVIAHSACGWAGTGNALGRSADCGRRRRCGHGDAHGTWTLTAANGDQLFVAFEASQET